MNKTTYKITKMDCASEESIVRMKLEGMEGIKALQFHIARRKLNVIHEGNAGQITAAIDSLNFNSSVVETEQLVMMMYFFSQIQQVRKGNYFGRSLQ